MTLNQASEVQYDLNRLKDTNIQAESMGALAFERFCTPTLSRLRSDNHEQLVKRARSHLSKAEIVRIPTSINEVQTYIFHPDTPPKANVLVVHGWTGEAAFMGAFADFLCRRGFRAILVDMPAHGESEGHRASIFECSTAIYEVAKKMGPIQYALGHSIGAMALLTIGEGHYPLPEQYPFEAYALVSMPNRFTDVTQEFGEDMALTSDAQRSFEKKLEHQAGRPMHDYSGSEMLKSINRPALLIHSQDDDEVLFSCAEQMVEEAPKAELQPFNGLGHRDILYTPPVVRTAVTFFSDHLSRK